MRMCKLGLCRIKRVKELRSFLKRLVMRFLPKSVTEGIRLALEEGTDPPTDDIVVYVVGGLYHETDSSDLAFKMAGIFAIKDAIKKAEPIEID